MTKSLILAVAFAVAIALPTAAVAQDERGAVVSGSVYAANIDSNTDIGVGGTFGYRFSRVFGFEIEAAVVPQLSGAVNRFPAILSNAITWSSLDGNVSPQIFPGPTISDASGRLVVFTNNARIEIPTASDRVLPYFVAGGGIASTRRTAQIVYFTPTLPTVPGVPTVPLPRSIAQPLVSTSTDLALTIGGGLGVRVARRMSVDVDLRLLRLLGAEDVNVGRFGVGARYRF